MKMRLDVLEAVLRGDLLGSSMDMRGSSAMVATLMEGLGEEWCVPAVLFRGASAGAQAMTGTSPPTYASSV